VFRNSGQIEQTKSSFYLNCKAYPITVELLPQWIDKVITGPKVSKIESGVSPAEVYENN